MKIDLNQTTDFLPKESQIISPRKIREHKSANEFISIASHQIRTPLGIIKWYLEALSREKYFQKGPQSTKKYFEEICRSNTRVLALVKDLLAVSRIDQGNFRNNTASINICTLLRDLVDHMQTFAHKRQITLTLTLPSQPIPSINIDRLKLQEVLNNLIWNAFEYTNISGLIEIKAHIDDNNLSVSVKDNGIGISKKDQKKIFNKFFRTTNAVQQNPEGSGLGLYIVKSYVEGWGGQVNIKSSKNNGSTFTVTIPLTNGKPDEIIESTSYTHH